ncbi:glycosyl transferase [Reyranella sp. MMS21-HV4-11]|uniref:Glycosyl transferase n=1 Tax=Reyranella humidisoli TaxID=2849149 RepID=A0ABS6IHH5_9HYPH|nr:glycosyltransferase [Reyranella sp. MMS21-HV4-11]MBU8873334.1 glycosyl transferase [Reyranella sp. MMS21-HV4-11]
MTARVFFYVQHLLGIGHLRRAAALARAISAGGFDVLLVSGGAPVDGLALGGARFHQLPPLRAADARLKELAQLDGTPVDEAFKAKRIRQLLDLFEAEQPDILLTEQFPFGRTQLRFELMPLLDAAQDRPSAPWIVSSIRDVLRRTASPARVDEMVQTFEAFDAVLVHADPALVRMDDSFPAWPDIRDRALYTGYVADAGAELPPKTDVGKGEVIVSAGGGAVGAPLLHAAIAARPLSPLADRRWRLLVGPNMPDNDVAALHASAGETVIVEPVRSDFPSLLRNAALSISQAGYNTVVETLCHGDRAVLVPFGTARETEQADRARVLVERGMVAAVAPDALTPASLAAAIARAWAGPSIRSFPPVDASGAAATVAALKQMVSP